MDDKNLIKELLLRASDCYYALYSPSHPVVPDDLRRDRATFKEMVEIIARIDAIDPTVLAAGGDDHG